MATTQSRQYGKAASKARRERHATTEERDAPIELGREVTSESKRLAIGLSEARDKRAKVPSKPPKRRKRS
jgi:hypothetical protein